MVPAAQGAGLSQAPQRLHSVRGVTQDGHGFGLLPLRSDDARAAPGPQLPEPLSAILGGWTRPKCPDRAIRKRLKPVRGTQLDDVRRLMPRRRPRLQPLRRELVGMAPDWRRSRHPCPGPAHPVPVGMERSVATPPGMENPLPRPLASPATSSSIDGPGLHFPGDEKSGPSTPRPPPDPPVPGRPPSVPSRIRPPAPTPPGGPRLGSRWDSSVPALSCSPGPAGPARDDPLGGPVGAFSLGLFAR